MSRIGLISDVHGNRLALDAVLAELAREQLDGLVCLGDIAIGPQPREALAGIRELGCPVTMGNWDAWFLRERPPPPPDNEVGAMLHEQAAFWADQLDEDDRAFMRTFVPLHELDLDGGATALCFHGSPQSHEDRIYSTTPDDELAGMLGDERPTVLIGGHTHVQLVRRFERTLLVNPGAVGLPFADWTDPIRIAPWAEYGVLEAEGPSLRVELHRATFDLEAFLRIGRASGLPHAEWWAASWLDPF